MNHFYNNSLFFSLVKDKVAAELDSICLKTTCVQRLEVKYAGPWREVWFYDASKSKQYLENEPVHFSEEVRNMGKMNGN